MWDFHDNISIRQGWRQGLGIVIRFIQTGEKVIIGSRKAEKAESAVDKVRQLLKKEDIQNLSGMSNEAAANKGDIFMLTVPLAAQIGTLKSQKTLQMEGY